MTGRGSAAPGMAAAGYRVLDLLTMADAAVLLGRRSVRAVRRLADAGELERVRFGRTVRITPESVEAYKQRTAGQAGAGRAS